MFRRLSWALLVVVGLGAACVNSAQAGGNYGYRGFYPRGRATYRAYFGPVAAHPRSNPYRPVYRLTPIPSVAPYYSNPYGGYRGYNRIRVRYRW